METTLYQYVKLGMHLEYLRGIGSISIMQSGSLAEFPYIMANLPGERYCVYNVVQTMRALLTQLDVLGLNESKAAAQAGIPLLQEMEGALAQAPQQMAVTLRDHFAEKLVIWARTLNLAIKEETSRRNLGA